MAQLVVSFDNTTTTRHLTTLGPTDWEHWQANQSRTRMTGTPNLLSDWSPVGSVFIIGFNGAPRGVDASNPSVNDADGILFGDNGTGGFNAGTGASWTCPADAGTPKTLTLLVGCYYCDATLTATLSDGSVSTQTDVQSNGGDLMVNYTITFQANGPATLTMTWVMTANNTFTYSNVSVVALALDAPAVSSGALADFTNPAARAARRLAAAASEAIPPLGRAFVAMATQIDRAPIRRSSAPPSEAFPSLAAALATGSAPDTAGVQLPGRPTSRRTGDRLDVIPPVLTHTGGFDQPAGSSRPRWQPGPPLSDAIVGETSAIAPDTNALSPVVRSPRPAWVFDTVPPIVSRTIESPTTYPGARAAPPRPTDIAGALVAPAAPAWTPDVAASTASPIRRAAAFMAPAPAPLFLLLGGFELLPAVAAPVRQRAGVLLDTPLPPPFAEWAPPVPETAWRPRARLLTEAVQAFPATLAVALTAWAPDLANAQRGWRRTPTIIYGGDPLPSPAVAAQIAGWGYETAVVRSRGPRTALIPHPDPLSALPIAVSVDAPTVAPRSARRAAALPGDPLAAMLVGAWGWEVASTARGGARRALPPPDVVVVGTPPPILVPTAQATRARIWDPAPAPTDPIPLFVAPVVMPWGYETVEAARRPRAIRAATDAVVAAFVSVLRFATDGVGRGPSRAENPTAGPTRTSGSGGRTRSGGS